MTRFDYVQADDVGAAIKHVRAQPGAQFLGGGTNLVDLIKENVARPTRLVGLGSLPLDQVERTAAGGLRIGARVTNAAVAYHPEVERNYPLLSKAILAGASPQLRNMATTGGNPLQRTRCYYFYDPLVPCNKREPGSGCPAVQGFNRIHAILGASDQCIAVHPSDMCVALAALEALVHVEGPQGTRAIPFSEFHRLPGDTPSRDNNLEPAELITAIELPPAGFADHHAYLKVRDRESYSFALVSVAAAFELKEGRIAAARLALGGVAHKPWRDLDAETYLIGEIPNDAAFQNAATRVLAGARGYGHNNFKIELARRVIVRALQGALTSEVLP